MSLGLVSYGSSDDEDLSDNDERLEPSRSKEIAQYEISDDEDDDDRSKGPTSILDEDHEEIPGLSSSTSFFQSIPSVTTTKTAQQSFVDTNEDLSTIPKAKVYSGDFDLKALKPKKKGPVRIMAPTINDLEEDDKPKPVVRQPSKLKSGLISLLPAPKGAFSTSRSSSSSVASAKPTMLVPRSVTNKTPLAKPQLKKSRAIEIEDEKEDGTEVPFFSLDASKSSASAVAVSSVSSLSVKSNPEASHPRGIQPGSHPSHQFRYQEDLDYGPATAPYPPPAPGPSRSKRDQDLLDNEEEIERLAGRVNKRRKGEEGLNNVIDVNFEDIKPDEREWLTKALTEDDADAPGPKNNVKGNERRKHQITYLAAYAKENENQLKKAWSTAAQNRRAAANKYGF